MDRDKKLQKLNSILQEWLTYSNLWNETKAELIVKTKVEKVKHETRKDKYGNDYQFTDQYVEKIPPTDYVKVTYFNPKRENFGKNDYESIEFPLTDIDKRIEHYENKVRNLKSKSNEQGVVV